MAKSSPGREDYESADETQPPVEKCGDPEKPPENPIIIVTKRDPITQKFKRVRTRRIKKRDFYDDDGELISEDTEL